MNFFDFVGGVEAKPSSGVGFSEFVIISGDFPVTGIALPLGNRKVRAAALRNLYLYKGKGAWNKIRILILQALNFAMVWKLVFRNDPSEEAKKLFAQFAKDLPDVLPDELRNIPINFSIYAGSRKRILPLFSGVDGSLLGVAKVYFSNLSNYGKNEVYVLKKVSELGFASVNVPKVLYSGDLGGFFALILSSELSLRNVSGITSAHIDFLKELFQKTKKEKELFSGSEFFKVIDEEQKELTEDELGNLYNGAYGHLREKKFYFSLTKREFSCFDLVRSESGYLMLDWEYARFDFPALFDLFSLLMSSGRFKRGGYAEMYFKNVEDLFFTKNETTKKILSDLCGEWKFTIEDAYYFFLLYLIDQHHIHQGSGHTLSAERIQSLFRVMRGNNQFSLENWLGGV